MLPGWPSRTSGACDGSGDTDFTYAGLWLQRAVLIPCRAMPVPNLLPRHHRAAVSPKSWGVQAVRVPCAPSCYCHLAQGAAPSLPQPSLAWVAPGHGAAMTSLAQPLRAPMEINPSVASVFEHSRCGFSALRAAPNMLAWGGCTVAGDAALGDLPEGTGKSQSSKWGQPASRPLLRLLMRAQVRAELFGWGHPAPGSPGPLQGA